MKNIVKKKEGITLIALVITIIVLLILAGVAIAMLSGENGILKKAAESKTKTEEASFLEQVKIAIMGAIINKDAKIDEGTLKTELGKLGVKEKDIVSDGDGGYIVKKENNSVNIKKDGNVESLEGISDEDIELEKYFLANNSKYKCRYGYITGIEEGDTVDKLQNVLPEGYFVMAQDGTENYTCKNSDGNPIIATGMTVVKNGEIVARTILFGDIDCNGKINTLDVRDAKLYLMDSKSYTGLEFIKVVLDIDCNGKMNSEDLKKVKSYIMNTNEMSQSRYVSNPDKIVRDVNSVLRYNYTLQITENDVYTLEYEEKEDVYNFKMKVSETKVGDLLNVLPEGSKIKRNEQEVETTENIQNGDKVIYVNEEKEIYIGKIIIE